MRIGGAVWRLGFGLGLGLAGTLGLSAPALADDAGATSDPCGFLERAAATPTPAAATACRLDRETRWGPDDPQLLPLYAALSERLSTNQKAAALALPLRRRAYALADRSYGAADPRSADAALDYARTWILSGRCEPTDPRVAPLLEAARTGYATLEDADPARPAALRRLSAAFADALRYEEAAEILSAAGSALDGDDWERVGNWRIAGGAAAGAEAAFLAALSAGPDDATRALRVRQALKRLYFATGALEKLRALDAE